MIKNIVALQEDMYKAEPSPSLVTPDEEINYYKNPIGYYTKLSFINL
jgi:hypothetical protein